MTPDIELQVQVVIKALTEVVSPAIDATNKAAIEQLNLSIATLQFVQDRVTMQGNRNRAQLSNAVTVCKRLVELGVCGDIEDKLVDAGNLRNNPEADIAAIRRATSGLMALAADAIDAVDDPAQAAQVGRAVIAATKAQTDLARAWFVRSGFELEPDKVPALATLISSRKT